jgi:protein disulfide-isomerase-like protein
MMKLLAAIAILLTISLVSAEVVELTEANFDEIVLNPNKDVLVAFTATWCGHCVRMKPAFKEYSEQSGDVVVANVDADANRGIMGKYGVRGFPTVKLFTKNDKSGKDFQGARNVDGFKSFVAANI